MTYPSAGTCSYAAVAPGYTCTYLSSQVDCAATGLVCQGGVCLAPPPPPPSEQLQAIRDAAAACASSYCPSSLAVNGAVVTYLRPAIGNEPAGFYLQADAAGPALLVEVDPATVGTTGLAVGDRVSLTVTRVSTWSGAVFAELISGFSRQARGVDVAPLVQDLSAAGDIVSALDSYADELVTVEGALSGSSVAAGTGFVQFPLETAGYPSGSANLRLRAASTVLDALDLVWGCTLVAGPAPLGRLGGTAQPTARAAGEVTLTGCPAPLVVAAIATGTTEVRITLDRRIDPASVLADGSQVAFTGGLVALAASASGRELTVVTSSQIPGTTYTATVAGTVTDQVGTGVALGARTASFVGYVVPAVLRLTELAPTIDSSRDLVELLVISGGRTGGGRLVELGTATKVLATLPDVTVATGDLVVVHFVPLSDAGGRDAPGDETTGKAQYPAADYLSYDDAWDFMNGGAGISSDIDPNSRVLRVEDWLGRLQDAVPFVDPSSQSFGFFAALQELQVGGLWLPASCGGAPCTNLTTPNASAVSVNWTGTGRTPGGSTVQRKLGTSSKSNADWEVRTSTLGVANAPYRRSPRRGDGARPAHGRAPAAPAARGHVHDERLAARVRDGRAAEAQAGATPVAALRRDDEGSPGARAREPRRSARPGRNRGTAPGEDAGLLRGVFHAHILTVRRRE